MNAVGERNLFWDLAGTFAPVTNYNPNKDWLELYIKPSVSFTGLVGTGTIAYGKISAVAFYTAGIDAYDTGNTGRITLEEGYLGLRTAVPDQPVVDFSLGPRELRFGTGMLIANGASNGFERGALKFGPRKAWQMAAIGRISNRGIVGTVFYLDPNELPSNNSDTKLAGINVRYDRPSGNYVGVTYSNVLRSNSAYPQAGLDGLTPPTIIPGAREGLNTTNFYARITPFQGQG